MRTGTLKQILLITDGCSNQGENPASVATIIAEQGITVNVIGIMEDEQTEQPTGLLEVEEIASCGRGVSQIVYKQALSQTVQTVTKQAMNETLQGVVNKELQQILGSPRTMEELPPEQRGEVMEVVDELGETCDLEVLVLVDTSASMANKLPTVQEALIDLSISMNARIGRSRFSIYQFPGRKKPIQQLVDWTGKLDSITSIFSKLASGGVTPTGPALKEAMHQFGKKSLKRRLFHNEYPDVEEA
ncbi:Ca-activated chloride channel family protein [Gracilibacillus ureilyticus]|uniref:Ca-activated chloride channel family protein n=1 Tax=Gracilibacillus ureilyticus TaxID=531814 RepID=A0A1H9VLT7_9BACI|nr:VWA domain-containing protein [Gracilibacillus ureilyticus]SES22665.1 Ca-activated chloride channel family protein [Gracilibacillus ureilyticus]